MTPPENAPVPGQTPPARVREQGWAYPSAYAPGAGTAAATGIAVGGYYSTPHWATPPEAPAPAQPIWGQAPGKKVPLKVIFAFVLAGIGAMVVLFFTLLESGFSETFVGALVALVPLALVLAVVRWVDRWEPEPVLYLALALAWGAGVATAAAMFINTRAFAWLINRTGDPVVTEILGVGVVAPIAEEILKGAGLLALLVWRRQLINGTIDLVVYAATIASGFAFTENILYFARGSMDGMLGMVFVGRGLMSPFAHIMFTCATALILGIVSHSRRVHLLWAFPLGLVVAIGLHSLWNLSASLAGENFIWVFVFVHVPIFCTFLGIVAYLRRRETTQVIAYLTLYSQAGWFAPNEVAMLASMGQRRLARKWAQEFGVRATAAMTQFHLHSTQLALNRHKILKNPTQEEFRGHERELLSLLTADREQFLAASGGAAPTRS